MFLFSLFLICSSLASFFSPFSHYLSQLDLSLFVSSFPFYLNIVNVILLLNDLYPSQGFLECKCLEIYLPSTFRVTSYLFQDYHSGCVTILEDMVKQLKWVSSTKKQTNHIGQWPSHYVTPMKYLKMQKCKCKHKNHNWDHWSCHDVGLCEEIHIKICWMLIRKYVQKYKSLV